jgi:hypothetical protein
MLQEDFLNAVRSYDIKSAKRLYGYLQEKNPYSPFVEVAAPAYLADIYIHYAEQMAFNPEASASFLAEAKRLAPDHPLLAECEHCDTATEGGASPVPAVEDAIELSSQVEQVEKVASAEIEAYLDELDALEQTLASLEAARVGEAAVIEPPAPGVEALKPLAEASSLATAPTDDACLLSFLTRSSPVSTCTDVLSSNQYGPSLFVVGHEDRSPLAFTQQPITRDAFNALCHESEGCKPEQKTTGVSGLSLDLTDVEATVNQYNAFCEMSQSCDTLIPASARTLLSPEKLPDYAKLLSKQTGYLYRQMTQEDVDTIIAYFDDCTQKEVCDESMTQDLARFLKNQRKVLLVRQTAH